MKVKCPNCGNEYELTRLSHDDQGYGEFYDRCLNCSIYFDLPSKEIISKTFITDMDKMFDFKILTKEEFLASYSYLTEDEYDATLLYLNWLNQDDSEP